MEHASASVKGIRGRWRPRSTASRRPGLELVEAGSVSPSFVDGVAVADLLLSAPPLQ